MEQIQKAPLFPLDQIVATPGALAALEKADQQSGEFVCRRVTGDRDELPTEDRLENLYNLEHGFRLLSSYRANGNEKVWAITEADRSATTLLLPGEY
jgi:hypothetical protein